MTGRFSGEHRFRALEQDWTMRFDFNALAEFEDFKGDGTSAMAFIGKMEAHPEQVSVSDLRALLWVGLLRHHPEATLKTAGDIMSEAPDVLTAGISAALPSQEAGKRPGKGKGSGKGGKARSSA